MNFGVKLFEGGVNNAETCREIADYILVRQMYIRLCLNNLVEMHGINSVKMHLFLYYELAVLNIGLTLAT